MKLSERLRIEAKTYDPGTAPGVVTALCHAAYNEGVESAAQQVDAMEKRICGIVREACWRVIQEAPETNTPAQDVKVLNDVLKSTLEKVSEVARGEVEP